MRHLTVLEFNSPHTLLKINYRFAEKHVKKTQFPYSPNKSLPIKCSLINLVLHVLTVFLYRKTDYFDHK